MQMLDTYRIQRINLDLYSINRLLKLGQKRLFHILVLRGSWYLIFAQLRRSQLVIELQKNNSRRKKKWEMELFLNENSGYKFSDWIRDSTKQRFYAPRRPTLTQLRANSNDFL